ncbi:MAG TPA: Nramp family divalent metal transporter [Puia sp.]|nr:Nramp family divalent metal transporter [Puia sp.]
MMNKFQKDVSLADVHGTVITDVKGSRWRQIFVFLGPAYLVSVGYMDPGNWATDLAGGSGFGYALLWVLLMSNLMALVLQNLSARLGIVRGRDLAQANREAYPKFINISLYILAEIAIAACDLAEVLGMAIGIQLLTGLPLMYGVMITILDTFLLLFLQRLGMRKTEAFIIGLIAIVGGSFLIEIILAKPNVAEIASGLIPSLPNSHALYIAIGIIGATIMPHNLYLHSALVQTRKIKKDDANIRRALRLNFLDSTIALNLAFLVNAAILILAATVFFKTNNTHVAALKQAYLLLPAQLGTRVASVLFAVALIAAGQSSTITGTLAGQIVMEGYLQLRINPWLRRLLTRLLAIIPSLIVIIFFGEKNVDGLLISSQVVLSVQLGFVIIPLIHFVSDKKLMGMFSIKPLTKTISWMIAAILIYLNFKLIYDGVKDYLSTAENLLLKMIIVLILIFLVCLLLYIFFYPRIAKQQLQKSILIHGELSALNNFEVPDIKTIAIALDFSGHDEKLIAHAIKQASKNATYILIHVVESASARMLGRHSDE